MAFKLAMNTGTFDFQSVDLPKVLQAILKGKFTGVNFRDNHIQEHLRKGHSLQEIKKLIEEYQLEPVAVDALRNWQEWEKWDSKKRQEYRDSAEFFFDECRQIGCLRVAAPTFALKSDLQENIRSFKSVCKIAKPYGILLALEFLPWVDLRDIRMAWEVVRRADCDNGGLLVDTFHFFKGGSKIKDFREVPVEKIFLVHLNDAPDLPIDSKVMCFDHRAFPGEGTFPLKDFLDVLILEKRYNGWISLEVLNQENPKIDYLGVAERGRRTTEKVLSGYQ